MERSNSQVFSVLLVAVAVHTKALPDQLGAAGAYPACLRLCPN